MLKSIKISPLPKGGFSVFKNVLVVNLHNLHIQVFLVTGGYGSDFLDSTEVYQPSVGSWVVAEAKLPRPTCCMSAININDRVLMFGRYCQAQLQSQIQVPNLGPKS